MATAVARVVCGLEFRKVVMGGTFLFFLRGVNRLQLRN
jgi:hypothetical protein